MEIVGRITKDAVVHLLKDDRKVVNFSIAVNDYFKLKNNAEGINITTYINCSYWVSTKIAPRLLKGTLVEINGRIYANAYTGANGEIKASLNCHVNNIKIHSARKQENVSSQEENSIITSSKQEDVEDDLPF